MKGGEGMKKLLGFLCATLLLLGGTSAHGIIIGQVGSRGFDSITHFENFDSDEFPDYSNPGDPFSSSGFDFALPGLGSFAIWAGGLPGVGFTTKSLYQNGGASSMDIISLTDGSDISQIEFDVSNGLTAPARYPQNIWVRTYNDSLSTGFDFDFNLSSAGTITIWSDGLTVFDEIRAQSYGSTTIDHNENQYGAISIDNIFVGTSTPVPEPATMLLLGTGLVGLLGFGRKKFKK